MNKREHEACLTIINKVIEYAEAGNREDIDKIKDVLVALGHKATDSGVGGNIVLSIESFEHLPVLAGALGLLRDFHMPEVDEDAA